MAEHQRAKLDRYQSHLFVTSYSVSLDAATGELGIYEMDAFVTDRALVTVRRSEVSTSTRWSGAGTTRRTWPPAG